MVWLDVLDLHLVNLMDASFLDNYPEASHPVTRPQGAAEAEAAMNMVPVDQEWHGLTTPIFNYPYARTREALERLRKFRAPDPYHGFKLKYINPVNGGWAMPTISTWMSLLPKGFHTQPTARPRHRSSFASKGGDDDDRRQRFEWGPKDIFVVPSWHFHEHDGVRWMRCCSASPTGSCRKSSTSSASSAATPEDHGAGAPLRGPTPRAGTGPTRRSGCRTPPTFPAGSARAVPPTGRPRWAATDGWR